MDRIPVSEGDSSFHESLMASQNESIATPQVEPIPSTSHVDSLSTGQDENPSLNESSELSEGHSDFKSVDGGDTSSYASQPDIKPFICQICHKGFSNKSNLDRHSFIHSDVKAFICNICGKGFVSKAYLSRHYMVHRKIKGRYCCSICGREMSRKSSIARHLALHGGENDIVCHTCGKEFTHRSILMRHILLHKPFPCDVCGAEFGLKSEMLKHFHKHHNTVKPYECTVCGKQYTNRRFLMVHNFAHKDKIFYP